MLHLFGDSSEIAIEGNFLEDCVKYPTVRGCYAYVSSYNQFEILDISKPNNITCFRPITLKWLVSLTSRSLLTTIGS